MLGDTYVIDRSTGTFSDSLLGVGVAAFIQATFGIATTIYDAEGAYMLRLERPIDEEGLGYVSFQWLLPYLLTVKSAGGRPKVTGVVDYEALRQRQTDYWDQRRQIEGETGKRWWEIPEDEAKRAIMALEPPAYWPLYQAINQMSAIAAYNGAVLTWEAARPHFKETVKAILSAFSSSPNQLTTSAAEWQKAAGKLPGSKTEITWSQIWNPASGKGQNRAKMDRAAMANSTGFWLWEYLKLMGARESLAPRTIQSNERTKDRKSYVIAAASLEVSELQEVFRRFHEALRPATAVKLDILSIINLTRAILTYLPERFEPGRDLSGFGPERAIRGLYTAYYKYLGTSAAVMNLSFLAVPGWMRVRGAADVDRYRGVLDEQQMVVGRIEEDRSEGYELLRTYRDFLSEGSIWPLLDFCGGYGAYLMSDWERPRSSHPRAWQLSTKKLEEVILDMEPNLAEIINSPGFVAVAGAIRRSTVMLQGFKSREQPVKYEIRYGLGTDLMRKANYKEEFAEALADFVQRYNAETWQRAENEKRRPDRRIVRTEDLAEVLALIDRHEAKLIGSLLVAFGYSNPRQVGPTSDSNEAGLEPSAGDPDAEADGPE